MRKLILLLIALFLLNFTLKAQNLPDWTRALQINTFGLPAVNVVTADDNNVYMAAKISGPITFEGINYTNVGFNDLIISKMSSDGVAAWTKQFNAQDGGSISPDAIKVDASGNVFVSGTFSGTITFGSSTITSGSLYNAFIAKIDNSGNGIWATPYLSTGTGSSKIALDGNGNSYLLSKTTKLIKIESSGAILWEQVYRDKTLQTIAVYGSNFFLGGTLQTGATSFGTITLSSGGGKNTGYMVKADLDGVYTNSIVVGGSTTGDGSSVSDIVVDNSGNLIITGSYKLNLILGGITITNPATAYYTYIAKCDNNFNFVWAQSSTGFSSGVSGNARQMAAYRIFLDNENNIYEYGIIDNSFSFGLVALTLTAGNQFLIKFDEFGNAINGFALQNSYYNRTWVNQAGKVIMGGQASDVGASSYGNFYFAHFNNNLVQDWQKVSTNSQTGIVTINYVKHDAAGNNYIQARVIGHCDYFGTTINTNSYLTVISKHDITGNLLWMNQIPDISPSLFGSAFTLDKYGNVLTTGLFKTSLNIGTTTLTTANVGNEGYVAKYSSDGALLWAANMDLNDDVASNITVASDNAGNVLVSGVVSPANYLVKFNASGVRLWAKIFPMESYYSCLVSTDTNNNIYISSEIHLSDATGSATIGTVTMTQTYDDGSIALIKFDPEGNALWAKTYGGVTGAAYSDGWACDIKTDENGNTYIWGMCSDNSIFGSIILTNPLITNQNYSDFLVKINTFGDVIWAKAVYETNFALNYGDLLDLDKNGNVYVGGHFKDMISIEGNEYLPEGIYDFFSIKYSGAGEFQWIKTIPSNISIINALSVYDDNILSLAGAVGKNSTLGNFDIARKSGSNCIVATLALLDPAPASVSMGSSGDSTAIYNIFTNTAWTVISDQDWLSVSSGTGFGCATITFTALPNMTTSPRTVTITITIADSRIVKTITIVQEAGTTDIDNITGVESVIYPNPANSVLFFRSSSEYTMVTIYDVNGKMLKNEQITGNKISIDNLRNGVFTIKIIDKTGVVIRKFIKQ